MTAKHDVRRRIPIVVLVLAVLGFGGWWAWNTYGPGATQAGTGLTASGTIEAQEAQVSALMSGRIVSSAATEGASVKKGDVLFTLDDRLLQLQVKQAGEGVDAAKAALQQVKDDKGTTAEKTAASARIAQAEAALDMARVQASYASVTAPSDGVLTAVAADPGEVASPGKALATIADLNSLYVSIYIPETEIGRVKLGDSAKITTDSSSETFSGTVSFIASEAEFTPSNIETKDQRVKLVYEVRVKLASSGNVLKPGMPVDVSFE